MYLDENKSLQSHYKEEIRKRQWSEGKKSIGVEEVWEYRVGKEFKTADRNKALRVRDLMNNLLIAIEKSDCTYREVICALDVVKENYEKKGNDLLDDTSIQKVASYNCLLG